MPYCNRAKNRAFKFSTLSMNFLIAKVRFFLICAICLLKNFALFDKVFFKTATETCQSALPNFAKNDKNSANKRKTTEKRTDGRTENRSGRQARK